MLPVLWWRSRVYKKYQEYSSAFDGTLLLNTNEHQAVEAYTYFTVGSPHLTEVLKVGIPIGVIHSLGDGNLSDGAAFDSIMCICDYLMKTKSAKSHAELHEILETYLPKYYAWYLNLFGVKK